MDKITAELGGNALAGGKAALKKINECIEKGVSFTQETTLSGRRAEPTARTVGSLVPGWLKELRAYLDSKEN